MNKLSLLFKKTVLVTLVAALTLAALPITSVYASGLNAPNGPPATESRQTDSRLERIWARLQRIYDRQRRLLERADATVEKAQSIIDRLEKNNREVIALQAALDAFDEALGEAHSVYESATGIVNTHEGFDSDGNVTDREQALETVRELSDKVREIRGLIGEPGKALREAFKAFRDAKRPADTSSLRE